MAAGIVLPYIHALHTAALLTLIGILANIYPAPQNLFQPSLVNALTMPDTAIRQIYFFRAAFHGQIIFGGNRTKHRCQVKDALKDKDIDLNGKEMRRIEAIILSMTPKERANTKLINGSRRKRIAMGSGTRVQDVNKLLKQFEEMQKMMKRMKKMQGGKKGGFGGLKLPFMH